MFRQFVLMKTRNSHKTSKPNSANMSHLSHSHLPKARSYYRTEPCDDGEDDSLGSADLDEDEDSWSHVSEDEGE